MAKRAINSGGTTPSGYDSGHTTPALAFTAAANDDQISYTEAFEVLSTVVTALTGIQYGVDTETGSGVADIAHTGSGIYDTDRASQKYFNGVGPLRVSGGSVDVTWMQFKLYNTAGGASGGVQVIGGGSITCKNCLSITEGTKGYHCYESRTQNLGPDEASDMTLDYCMGTMDMSSGAINAGLRVWNHNTSTEIPTLTARNCTMICFSDAGVAGRGYDVDDDGTDSDVILNILNCELFGRTIGLVAGGADVIPGDSSAGHNASTFAEGEARLGTDRYESDDATERYEDIGAGRDLTPLFPSTRVGSDNSANAALDDNGDSVDFAGVVIGTFDIGCFDQGIAGGGETLNDLEAGSLEVWALVSSMNGGAA